MADRAGSGMIASLAAMEARRNQADCMLKAISESPMVSVYHDAPGQPEPALLNGSAADGK
jgi:hypothetical protein